MLYQGHHAANPDGEIPCADDAERLASCLAFLARKHPDLAELARRWEALPDVVRAGIVAMAKSAAPGGGKG